MQRQVIYWPKTEQLVHKMETNETVTLTVPSSIFNSACWTPSPETSLLILMLSACMQEKRCKQNTISTTMYLKVKILKCSQLWICNENLFRDLVNFINIHNTLLGGCYIIVCNLKCEKGQKSITNLASFLKLPFLS